MQEKEFDTYDSFRDCLLGKTIEKIFLDKRTEGNDDLISFQTTDGLFSWETYGDCCSTSWIEHISGVENLMNAIVIDVEEVDGEEIRNSEYEYLQVYFYKFKTSKGDAQIDMRNASNGYYGGSFHRKKEVAKTELKDDF